jgi:tetratricopeptide (TPR) repeat protein
MAATDSKPSPTNQPVQQNHTAAAAAGLDPPGSHVKDKMTEPEANPPTPRAAAAAAAPPAPPQPQKKQQPSELLLPNYERSEASEHYVAAKALLAAGEFEEALATIEEGIETTKVLLESSQLPGSVTLDLHESLAPFHYLYGTTLLYSIEESSDTQQVTSVGQDAAGGGGEEEESSTPAAAAMPNGGGDEEEAPVAAADNVEDIQIAWENLDAARTIVEQLLDSKFILNDQKVKLQLDLAQIFLREGDLQRMNGLYAQAIEDYHACLQLRQAVTDDTDLYNRKIADAQYNLGLSYLTSSSELKKEPSADETDANATAAAANAGAPPPMDQATRDKLSEEHRLKGIHFFLECCKVLCGKIALLCGVDPEMIVHGTGKEEQAQENEDSLAPKKAGLKTTGLDDDAPTSEASTFLRGMRQRVFGLEPLDAEDPTVSDLMEFLDEIQENVDEAANSQEAVRQASELRVQAQKAAASSDDNGTTTATVSASGAITTIGFGAPTLSAAAVAAAAEANNTTSSTNKPMMVIKKKKKRDAPAVEEEEDSKMPAKDDSNPWAEIPPKRAKTDLE